MNQREGEREYGDEVKRNANESKKKGKERKRKRKRKENDYW